MAEVVRGTKPVRAKAIGTALDNHSGADTDDRLVELWLERYDSWHTRRCYALDIDQFLAFVGALTSAPDGLQDLTVAHVVAYLGHLREHAAPATQARRVSSLKSLLSFAHQTGYLRFNVGAAVKSPKFHDHVAERILTLDQVREIAGAARPGRDRAFIRFLYFSGARVSEACQLQWKHVRSSDGTLRVTLHGKGKKTRHIPLPPILLGDFDKLEKTRLGSYVFESCYGKALDPKDAWRIVRRATKNAYCKLPVSPHWFRHAHATHALRRGAPVNVVQETLGHASLSTTGRYTHIDSTESSGLFLSL